MDKKRSAFSGTSDIFAFTFKNAIGGKGYIISTIIVALLISAALMLVSVIPAAMTDDEEPGADFTITKVIAQNSGEFPISAWSYLTIPMSDTFGEIEFSASDESLEVLSSRGEAGVGILTPERTEDNFKLTFTIPEGSGIDEEDAEELISVLSTALFNLKATEAGLTEEYAMMMTLPLMADVSVAGKDSRGIAEILVELLAPMVFVLVVYMMTILYGQTISKTIISEKSSKLMETLLTSVRPYAIIAGKITAMWLVSIIQFMIWVGSGIIGFIIGDMIAKSIDPGYVNYVVELVELMREHSSPDAMSIVSAVLAILTLLMGLLFYFVLAGLVSSKINRAEELQSGMVLFQMPILASFMLTYIMPITGGAAWLIELFPYIPFTAAFYAPSSILIGSISLAEGVTSLVITVIATVALILVTGYIYRANVLNQGKPLFKRAK